MSEYGTYDELVCENCKLRREAGEMLKRHGNVIAEITLAALGIADQLTHDQLIESLRQQRTDRAKELTKLAKAERLNVELIHASAELASSTMEQILAKVDESPAVQALDDLWREIILTRRPDYGHWDYPAQAFRHLLAEIKEIVREQGGSLYVTGDSLSDDPCKLYEEKA